MKKISQKMILKNNSFVIESEGNLIMDEKKKIKILSTGPIECCGFVWGPVLTPYMETTSKIFKMISAVIHVVEVLEDGTEVRLTVENLRKDNSVEPEVKEDVIEEPKAEEVVEVPSIESEQVEEVTEVTETVDDVKLETIEVAEEPKAEEVVEEVKPIITDEVNNRNNNKNKHNRR